MFLQRRHVSARILRQVAQRTDVVDRFGPPGELVIDGGRARERRGARRPGVYAPTVDLVRHADPQPLDAGEDVELVEHDRGDAVDRYRVPQRDGVEPADPARSPGDRAVFITAFGDAVADPVEQLGRIGTRAHTGRIRLHDADDLVDLERPDAAARARATGDRVRRGDERIAAMV